VTTYNFTRRAAGVFALATLSIMISAAQVSVTTYHYDNYRTGWNSQETVLTPAAVGGANFGLLQTVDLDGQVDAQPLVVPNVMITAGANQGPHDVVYVATSANIVYAIDTHSGVVLLHADFGTPVTEPLGCNNNAHTVGITSTPVIDTASSTLYVMVYNQDTSVQNYRLHALDLGSLVDRAAPQVVTASHTLANGTTYTFNAGVQRQRPGLLLANGNIYAGFGSFCDYSAGLSRGWLLGWNAASLEPLAGNQLNDTQDSSPDSFFLSSIWMSGYAPATDDAGNVLFVTGNSDYSGTTYDGVTNIQESVVKVSASLTGVLDLFTPDDQASLDEFDTDFGSGGVLVLPDQPGAVPHLAVAAGKDGNMYLMNEDDLGGYSTSGNNVLGTYSIGACWCGQSYFAGPNGEARVVSSGGNSVGVWLLGTSTSVGLKKIAVSASLPTGQFGGFFTSVSSNGTATPIVWALTRPQSKSSTSISLYAFNPENSMAQIYTAAAGTWPNYGGDSNQIPVVANGKVFVASYRQLQIFGIK
jgi:hypothetical protein